MFRARFLTMAPLLLSVSAHAAEQKSVNPVLNEMAQEMTECAAYFGAVSVGAENSNKPKLAKDYEKLRDQAIERAYIINEAAGLKKETVGARLTLTGKEMVRRLGGDTSNISILMADYMDLCLEVMQNPEKRGDYWTNKKMGLPPR